MNFADEEYVRLYVADTVTWRVLPWEARAVLVLALRKFDHAGVFEFGRHGANRALTAAIDVPIDMVSRALESLLTEGVWILEPDRLFWPKYIEAQNCKRSDRLRQRISRARRAETTPESGRDDPSQPPTECDELSRFHVEMSRVVTDRHDSHELSHVVTPGRGKGEAGRDGKGEQSGSDTRPTDRFMASFAKPTEAAKALFEAWKLGASKPNASLDSKRAQFFGALALEGITPEQVAECMRGAKLDPWAISTGLAASAILGSAEQREKFAGMSGPKPKPAIPEPKNTPYRQAYIDGCIEDHKRALAAKAARERAKRLAEREATLAAGSPQTEATAGKAAPE